MGATNVYNIALLMRNTPETEKKGFWETVRRELPRGMNEIESVHIDKILIQLLLYDYFDYGTVDY